MSEPKKVLHIKFKYFWDMERYPKTLKKNWTITLWFPPKTNLHRLAKVMCQADNIQNVWFDVYIPKSFCQSWRHTYSKDGYKKQFKQGFM
jgi:hypothetical protein